MTSEQEREARRGITKLVLPEWPGDTSKELARDNDFLEARCIQLGPTFVPYAEEQLVAYRTVPNKDGVAAATAELAEFVRNQWKHFAASHHQYEHYCSKLQSFEQLEEDGRYYVCVFTYPCTLRPLAECPQADQASIRVSLAQQIDTALVRNSYADYRKLLRALRMLVPEFV
jgi:hypothetical protein